jgi:hypothetical protein
MEDLIINIFGGILLWGIYLALAVKLLGAEKLAKTLFEGAFLIPQFGGMAFILVSLPYAIYGLSGYFLESQALRISILTFSIVALFIVYLHSSREYFEEELTFLELVKERFVNFKFHVEIFFDNFKSHVEIFLAEKILPQESISYSNDYTEIFSKLDSKFRSELDKRSTNNFLAVVFFIFSYYLLKGNEGFEYFVDYKLSAWFKYLLLITSFFVFLYLYSKYYSLFPKNTYREIFKLVNFLANEKKYVLLISNSSFGYKFSIENTNPWDTRGNTNYYYFVTSEDGEVAYWLKPSMDYRHFKQIATGIYSVGVEAFLDNVLKKNEINAEE